jgi:hypothetical protein
VLAEEVTSLQRQKDFKTKFESWFNSNLSAIIEDNRRRYRMKLKDEAERKKRNLSAIPSVQSTVTVDRAVERALIEYHGEPDAITLTSRGDDPQKDLTARWMTEVFKYRAKRTFPFFTWHACSLTAAFADGLEAAMVRWHKESYTEKRTERRYFFGEQEVPEEAFLAGMAVAPEGFREEEIEVEEEVTTKDTFWIDSLKPGEDLLWDFKAPLLDLNLGGACMVRVYRRLDELEQLADLGVLDKFDKAAAKKRRELQTENPDATATTQNPGMMDLGDDLNKIECWVWFEKVEGRWMCEFSLKGEKAISSRRSVDEVFFNGRRVGRLPVVLGTHKFKLWEAVGRGEPEAIGPLEDEHVTHKNNVADAAKIAVQGRWRVDRGTDIKIDDLLNARVFEADRGEYDKLDQEFNTVDSLRVMDAIKAEMAEVVPVGMENKNLVPRGTARTLGAVQMALGAQNEKLSVQLLVRNQTFFEPLLYLIAQMIIAYETDETILRIAGKKVQAPPAVPGGQPMPFQVPTMGGAQPAVDLSALDFDVEVQINAGLGTAPRQEKAQLLIQIAEWRKAYGLDTDFGKIGAHLNVLAGFEPDSFSLAQPSPPPGPELSGSLNIDVVMLDAMLKSPQGVHPVVQRLLQAFIQGSQNITANFQAMTPKPAAGEGAGQRMPMGERDPASMDMMDSAGGIEAGGQGGY